MQHQKRTDEEVDDEDNQEENERTLQDDQESHGQGAQEEPVEHSDGQKVENVEEDREEERIDVCRDDDEEEEEEENLEDISTHNKQYRPHRTEASMSHVNSHSMATRSRNSDSVSSFASTSSMNPLLVRSKVKSNLQKKQKASARNRLARKGEAAQTTAKRRENRDTVKQSLSAVWF